MFGRTLLTPRSDSKGATIDKPLLRRRLPRWSAPNRSTEHPVSRCERATVRHITTYETHRSSEPRAVTHQKHTDVQIPLDRQTRVCWLTDPNKIFQELRPLTTKDSTGRASVSFFRRSRYSEPLCAPRRKSVTVKLPLALAQILNGERHNDYEYDRFIFISKDLDIIHRSHLWIFSPPPLASRTLPHHRRTSALRVHIPKELGNVIRSGSTPTIDVT